MTGRVDNERGAAMVLAIGALAVLAVLALVVVAIVISEKQTALADYTGSRSFYSADAASEAGVNWIKKQTIPPPIVDASSNVLVSTAFTTLSTDHSYKFDVQFVRKRVRPGWSVEYKDYEYRVTATGASVQGSQSAVDVGVTRLYREGY
jgi:Tfp pilus assembly protein PilX